MDPHRSRTDGIGRTAATAQGLLYLTTGLWPILAPRSFQRVTGPKTDVWLVKTMGALLAADGWHLLRERRAVHGLSRALVLGGADFTYGLRGRISRVYLVDGVVEAGFAALHAVALFQARAAKRKTGGTRAHRPDAFLREGNEWRAVPFGMPRPTGTTTSAFSAREVRADAGADRVDEASAESFPASDSPSFNP